MEAGIEIHEGAQVTGPQGEKLGVIDAVRHDPASGSPSSIIVKTGFWIFSQRKVISTDIIREVSDDADTVIIDMSKQELRGVPAIDVDA